MLGLVPQGPAVSGAIMPGPLALYHANLLTLRSPTPGATSRDSPRRVEREGGFVCNKMTPMSWYVLYTNAFKNT